MPERAASHISFSLVKLHRLRAGFDELSDGRPIHRSRERTLLRLARQLGATAIPTCARELQSLDEDRSRWAYAVLGAIATVDGCDGRVVAALRDVADADATSDVAKLRALALLTELGIPTPASPHLHDPAAARARSLRDLAGCLGSPSEVARAGDLLVEQLAPGELCEFIGDLSEAQAAEAAALAVELLLRDDLDERTLGEIRRLSAPLLCNRELEARVRAKPRVPRSCCAAVGRHQDGRVVVIARARRAGSRPPRWRVYCAVLSPEAILIDGHYADDMTHSAIDRELVRLLGTDGFAMEDIGTGEARDLVAHGARGARIIMPRIPRTYFLGRDILGISDEHLGNSRSMRRDHLVAALHARATDLLAAGDAGAARPLLERYVAEVPDDAEGCAALGLCVLALDEPDLARRYLDRAVWLEPENPRHLWNLAAAAHASGRLGACFLALSSYLESRDSGWGSDEDRRARRQKANEFVAEYDRLARLQHPALDPAEVARKENGPPPESARTARRRR